MTYQLFLTSQSQYQVVTYPFNPKSNFGQNSPTSQANWPPRESPLQWWPDYEAFPFRSSIANIQGFQIAQDLFACFELVQASKQNTLGRNNMFVHHAITTLLLFYSFMADMSRQVLVINLMVVSDFVASILKFMNETSLPKFPGKDFLTILSYVAHLVCWGWSRLQVMNEIMQWTVFNDYMNQQKLMYQFDFKIFLTFGLLQIQFMNAIWFVWFLQNGLDKFAGKKEIVIDVNLNKKVE